MNSNSKQFPSILSQVSTSGMTISLLIVAVSFFVKVSTW
jgi:hypothetical protein